MAYRAYHLLKELLSFESMSKSESFSSFPNSVERDHDEGFSTTYLASHSSWSHLYTSSFSHSVGESKKLHRLGKVFHLQCSFIGNSTCFTCILGKISFRALMLIEQLNVISFKGSFPFSCLYEALP